MPTDYDSSPASQDVPVNLEEVGGYLTGELKWLKDSRKAAHFLRRVWIALDQAQRRAHELQRGIQYLQEQAAKQGTMSNVHPAQVAKFLTPEQIASLADSRYRQLLSDADRLHKEAETTRRSVLAERNRLHYVLSTLLEDGRLSAETRELITHHLHEFEQCPTPLSDSSAPAAPAGIARPVPPPPSLPRPATLPPPPVPPAAVPAAPLPGAGLPPPATPDWALPTSPPGSTGNPAAEGAAASGVVPSRVASGQVPTTVDPRPDSGDLDDLFG